MNFKKMVGIFLEIFLSQRDLKGGLLSKQIKQRHMAPQQSE